MNSEQGYKRAGHHLYMNQGTKYKIKQFKYTNIYIYKYIYIYIYIYIYKEHNVYCKKKFDP